MENIDIIKSLLIKDIIVEDTAGKNVVIYTRVSSKEQADNNGSLESQKMYCEKLAASSNYAIVEYFGGTYESAQKDERNEFVKMLNFIKSSPKKIHYIIVYSLDRFSRTGPNAIFLSSELRKTNVHIQSCLQNIDTKTSSGVLQQSIHFIFSNYENELRKEKCVAGMKEKLKKGFWFGKAPLGYEFSPNRGEQKIIINPIGNIVRQAFLLKAEQGLTNKEISERSKALGYEIKEKRFTDIFRNPFYCGYIHNNILGGEIVLGNHEALISEEIFLKVNNIISKYPTNFTQRKTDEHLPLKRFIKCENCGTTWVGYLVTKKNAYYYKCNKKGCLCNRNASKMHDKFQDYISSFSINESFIEPLKLQLSYTFSSMNQGSEKEKLSLENKLKEVGQKIDKVEERFALGEIDDKEVYNKIRSKFLEDYNQIEGMIRRVDIKLSNPENFINYSVKLSSKLNTMWSCSNFDMKQKLQRLMFPEGVTYDFKNDSYRTCKVNSVFTVIAGQARLLEEQKSGLSPYYDEKSASVSGSRLELPTFGL
ncbi:MAG: putative bacteriophage resolvase/recombinase [Chitinophagaceae bacterium]|nr:putative bacteriophage resolvase/recombinase [Chitinophagaceae bacterium]